MTICRGEAVMRLKIRRPEKSTDKTCSVCQGHKNLLEFYDIDDDTLCFCLCNDCIEALHKACVDSFIFEEPKKVKITPKMACVDTDSESFKAGYREGYRDGFKDNYELKD